MNPTNGSAASTPAVFTLLSAPSFLVNRSYYPKIALSADRLILPMNSQKQAIWVLDNVNR
jgi:hypothetical protein